MFAKRWEAKRHAKKATCAQAHGLSPDMQEALLAYPPKPPKKALSCDICGIELKGHCGLEVHNASARHLAKLLENTSKADQSGKSGKDTAKREEEKQKSTQQTVSGISEPTRRCVEVLRPPLSTLNVDWDTLLSPLRRTHQSPEADQEEKKATQKRRQVTCGCGSSFQAGKDKAHNETHKHRMWVQDERLKAEKANQEREREEMRNEDTLGKYIVLDDPTTSKQILFKVFKQTQVYKGKGTQELPEWFSQQKLPAVNKDDDVDSDQDLITTQIQSYNACLRKSLRGHVISHKLIDAFYDYAARDTSVMSKEQKKHLSRVLAHRYLFDGNLKEARGRVICYVAVLVSCFRPCYFWKTQSQEASDKMNREVTRPGRPFRVYMATCRLVDHSCRNEPLYLRFFVRNPEILPRPMEPNQVRILVMHKGRVSHCSTSDEYYLSAGERASWVICSLYGEFVETYGKPFCPPDSSLIDMVALAYEIQDEFDTRIKQEQKELREKANAHPQTSEPSCDNLPSKSESSIAQFNAVPLDKDAIQEAERCYESLQV